MATNSNAGRQSTGKTGGGSTGKGTAANTAKRKNRRLKRSIRKTLGALFLASALVVAAIPVDGLQAAPVPNHNGESISVNVFDGNKVPQIDKDATIYSYYMEGTSVIFRFAYVSATGQESGDSRYAVILGYEQVGNLAGGTLKIPESMEAYRKYSVESTITGSAAVNLDNQFLYYEEKENKLDASGNPMQDVDKDGNPIKDSAGNPVYLKESVYYPCLYSTRDKWVNRTQFFIMQTDSAGNPIKDPDGKYMYKENTQPRIANAMVSFIGNQYLEEVRDDPDREFRIVDTVTKPEQGVFNGKTNITTLVLPDSISGIGDYAFANCGFATVKFGNGLNCLGNYAFLGCGSMTQVQFEVSCGLTTLGEGCFKGCSVLPSIDLPGHVQEIGNFAFEGCTQLSEINMIYPDHENDKGESAPLLGTLTAVGQNVFKDCASLSHLVLPNTYTGSMDVSEFQGCVALEYIRSGYQDNAADGSATFFLNDGDWAAFGWEQFLAQCPKNPEGTESKFYLWGRKNSKLHQTATEKKIAFKFYDPDLLMNVYEKVVSEIGDNGQETGNTATFWVNENNELVKCDISNALHKLTLPESIGPKNINAIGSGTFRNKCNLNVVTIPASVANIADSAFQGCHNLKWVIYTDAEKVSSIGTGAFNTQDITASHISGCSGQTKDEWFLNFVGTISPRSVPFQYAMSDPSVIGLGTARKTFLTYYSGFPTHLVVRRNEATGTNELIDYPTVNDLRNQRYTIANGYDYMSKEDEEETKKAIQNYPNSMTNYQKNTIMDAVLNLRIPDGVESIATVQVSGTVSGGNVSSRAAGTATLVDDALTGAAVAEENAEAVALGKGDSQKIGLFSYRENNVGTSLLTARGMSAYPTNGSPLTDSESARTAGLRKTLVTKNVRSFTPGAMRDCDAFQSVTLEGAVQAVGHYAFADCDNLDNVSIAESVATLGRVPFIGSGKVSNVNFNGSANFSCDNSIIYQLDGSGKKYKLIEYLYGRTNPMVEADEVSSVSELAPEAFSGTKAVIVDFGESALKGVPEDAFRGTEVLANVTLPSSCVSISQGAFSESGLQQLRIPGSVAVIHPEAFEDMLNASSLSFKTPENSIASEYAKQHKPVIKVVGAEDPVYCEVKFMSGHDFSSLGTRRVLRGESVTAPQVPEVEGKTFTGWSRSLDNITEDTTIIALYEEIKEETFTVEFFDWDDTPLRKVTVVKGGNAGDYAPNDLSREGYRFTGWDRPINNVTSNIITKAQYEKIDSSELTSYTVRFTDWDGRVISTQKVEKGKNAVIPQSPTRAGYTFMGWLPMPTNVTRDMDPVAQYEKNTSTSPGPGGSSSPGPGGSASPGPGSSASPGPGTSPTPGPGNNGGGSGDDDDDDNNGWDDELYTLTVRNGSGSGSYVANSSPVIIADQASSTQEFDHWTIQPEQALIGSTTQQSTIVTMPHCDVIVTAHYRTKPGTGGNVPVNPPVYTPRPSGGNGNNTNGSTQVVIDKNGLSNTGVVTVVINGSSDNFVMKVTENSDATESILRALMAEYGSLDNIKYFPMDISLYDSTGSRRITDTTGLKIDITLPLPDSLKAYAGNNKVAGVVNGRLDKLSPKFTTINGVPCVTFSAEHFSPYVIYVDTSRLGQGTVADDTPKTGDLIHPKWFLSIGLACLSFVMFMKKDTRKKQKVAVKAK